MKALASWVVALALVGCSCDGEAPTLAPHASIAAPEPAEPVEHLPTASRTDLPAASPAITITVRRDEFLVSNRAVVETWPGPERTAVGRTRALGDADYPVVDREIDDASDALTIPGLRAAMVDVAAVESARAAIVHAEGSPTAFAVRADADVHFGRVLAAVFAAAMVGLNQPRLVLASASGERELRLTLPDTAGDPDDPAVAAAVAQALATLHGTPAPELDAGLAPRPPRTSVLLDASGLVLRRGDVRIGAGCAAPVAADANEPSIAAASITASAIDACVTTLGATGAIVFRTARETRYADAVGILEVLAAHHEVNLAAAID